MADRKLFVGNLVRRIIQDDLWNLYARYGPLEECAKFHESFGFVRFVYSEDARHALDDTRHTILKGRPIKVEYAAATTACRSAPPTCANQRCSNDRRYIPPLRAADLPSYGGPYRDLSLVLPPSEFTPLPVHSRDHQHHSESKALVMHSHKCSHSSTSCSSPPSSYAASSTHVAEIDDYDCDLDSGYHDESESPVTSLSSTSGITNLPWCDTPLADEVFVWDFQLYANIARELPPVKVDHLPCELTDDEALTLISVYTQWNMDTCL